MNSTRLLATFVIALVLAGVVSLLVVKKLRQGNVRAAGPGRQVVVAARDVEVGAKLEEADLKVVDWNAGDTPQGAFNKVSEPLGRAAIYPLFKNEPILEAKLAQSGAGAGLPAVIPEGMRAVSIRVDDVVAVAGFVGPGTRVDVLLTGDPGRNRGDESLTKTILENVQVLAAGQKIQPDAQGKPEKVNVVTLLCTPEDAAKVTLAANEGRIQLVLRNPADRAKAEKQPIVVRQSLYQGGTPVHPPQPAPVRRAKRAEPAAPPAPPAPAAPAPPPVSVVEIIRAQTVSRVELPPIN